MTVSISGFTAEEGQDGKVEEVRMVIGRYQTANAVAFLINVIFVAIPGRLDTDFAKEDWPGNGVVAYATPALWAFAIWAAIYLTELVFVIWQCRQRADIAPVKRLDMIRALTPGWCAGHCFQAVWCLTYRDYLFSFATFWIPCIVLTLTPLGLGFAHRAAAARVHGAAEQALVLVPITMHFGWTTAAGLLNWNQWITLGFSSLTVRLAALGLSLAVAATAGLAVTWTQRAPGYACTLAWAVIALGSQTLGSEIMAGELGADGAFTLALVELSVGVGLAVLGLGTKAINVMRGTDGNDA